MKNSIHFADAFFRTPLLIEAATLRIILAALNTSAAFSAPQAAYGGGRSGNVVMTINGAAVVPVLNVLSYRASDLWSYLFGGTSYQGFRNNFRQALGDSTVSSIVLDVASPGGTVEGLFDLVDEIYQARGVKPIYAIINESAYSAAYAIASAADKVFLPRLGGVGSIGAMAVHIDESAADAKAGLKYTEIYAGDRKIDGTPYAPLTVKARSVYEKMVGQAYDLFVSTVARNRGLLPADVRAQQSAIYTGKAAVSARLADAVLSWDAAWKRVVGSKTNKGGSVKTKLESLFAEYPKETVVQTLSEFGYMPKEGYVVLAGDAIPSLAAALGITVEQLAGDPMKIDFETIRTAAIHKVEEEVRKDTIAYALSIHEICALGGQERMAPALIREEVKIEDARARVLSQKASESERTEIRSMISVTSADGSVTLLADAKNRADLGAKKLAT